MLFFSRNKIPSEKHKFYFATPQFERQLNTKGYLRIDYNAAQPVSIRNAINFPWLLKTLAIGTVLDVEVFKSFLKNNKNTIMTYWKQNSLFHGRGYDISPKQKRQLDASFLYNKPDFARIPKKDFTVDISLLPKFKREKVHAPRISKLYTAPILIVPEAPGSLFSPKSFVIKESVAFSKSYYGFSADNHKNGNVLIAFLHLLTHSTLFRYYILMTSSRFGAERRTFLKESLEDFPFPDFDQISSIQYNRILKLGEERWRIHLVGSTAFDDIQNQELRSKGDLANEFGLNANLPWILMLQHPTPLDSVPFKLQIQPTIRAIRKFHAEKIIILGNSDTGSGL
jgi:hypothetical protein